MMVTVGSCAPRTWSVLLSAGKMDGESGPGVGSARSVVQAGGVGIIMFGVADATFVGSAADGAQAVMTMEIKQRGNKKEENFGMFDSIYSLKHPHLMAS